MSLTDAQYELFEHLTERPFLVLDLEYCRHEQTDRIVSAAVTPVIRGKRTTQGEVYVEMNPGVPIDAATAAIHGFTDEKVKGKRRFPYYAPRLLAALNVPDAILVTHTSVDARVLGEELRRAEEAAGSAITFGDLPDLPILDTSTLPRLVQHPVAAGRSVVSLKALCEGLNIPLTDHHHARADTRATADALVKLLRHTATAATFGSIDAILTAGRAGSAQAPAGALYVRHSRRAPALPAQHLQEHAVEPLTHAGSAEERAAWMSRARECVGLRCHLLREEAELAAPNNGAELLEPLSQLIDDATEHGQGGVLAGALRALIRGSGPLATQPVTSHALARGRVTYWWRAVRPALRAAPRCSVSRGQACPDCWDLAGCPRDLLYQTTTEEVVFSDGPNTLTAEVVRNRFLKTGKLVPDWSGPHPLEASYVVELICRWAERRGTSTAAYIDLARSRDIELREPRLALRVLTQELPVRGFERTARLAEKALEHRNTDPAYLEIEAWLALNGAAAEADRRASVPREIVRPRLARPEGRVPVNPYKPF